MWAHSIPGNCRSFFSFQGDHLWPTTPLLADYPPGPGTDQPSVHQIPESQKCLRWLTQNRSGKPELKTRLRLGQGPQDHLQLRGQQLEGVSFELSLSVCLSVCLFSMCVLSLSSLFHSSLFFSFEFLKVASGGEFHIISFCLFVYLSYISLYISLCVSLSLSLFSLFISFSMCASLLSFFSFSRVWLSVYLCPKAASTVL